LEEIEEEDEIYFTEYTYNTKTGWIERIYIQKDYSNTVYIIK